MHTNLLSLFTSPVTFIFLANWNWVSVLRLGRFSMTRAKKLLMGWRAAKPPGPPWVCLKDARCPCGSIAFKRWRFLRWMRRRRFLRLHARSTICRCGSFICRL